MRPFRKPHPHSPILTEKAVGFVLGLYACVISARGQEALRSSLAGQEAAEARRRQVEERPYNFKRGDLRMLATPSFGIDWSDNLNLSGAGSKSDVILRPMLTLGVSYPISAANLLSVNVGIGYDYYLANDEFSGFRLSSGSEIAFDLFVKDFRIDFHNRFRYSLDAAGRSDIAGTGLYGGFDNTAGVTVDWDLQDLVLTMGYDHQNFVADNGQFQSNNRASENLVARGGLKVRPDLVAGAEGTVSFTSYDQDFLNDSVGYSAGAYARWHPSRSFSLMPRLGYSIYSFDQTSRYLEAADRDAWYFGLTLNHRPREAVEYSLSVGHELRLAAQADMTEITYVRPSLTWRIVRSLSLQISGFYEHGNQGLAGVGPQQVGENFNWYGGGLTLGYQLMRRMDAALTYRVTFRDSDVSAAERGYTQNLVGLQLTYRLP